MTTRCTERSELSDIVPVPRQAAYEYVDPLESVWTWALAKMGVTLVRSRAGYAHMYGNGMLGVAPDHLLDPDDSIAQIALHEICHWLVEGADSIHAPNFGLTNETLVDLDREYASLRVQAALTEPYGLRRFLANTTDHRAYYDALPDDPLAPLSDPTSRLARLALARAQQAPWAPALQQALATTAAIVAATAPLASLPSLFVTAEPAWPRNPLGYAESPRVDAPCESCAWHAADHRCMRCERAADPAWRACEGWEPALDCERCAACLDAPCSLDKSGSEVGGPRCLATRQAAGLSR